GEQLMQAVLRYARQRDDIETVVSLITSDNAASIHLHETLGFSYCGQIRNAGTKFGKRLHLNIYELTFV
ncbi:MAG: GNAT family N-acetyltransferase, partial [Butyricicoccus porcorum]|nr:GNAT family N-acetyltransferase [Butyricicoccus porcorum]